MSSKISLFGRYLFSFAKWNNIKKTDWRSVSSSSWPSLMIKTLFRERWLPICLEGWKISHRSPWAERNDIRYLITNLYLDLESSRCAGTSAVGNWKIYSCRQGYKQTFSQYAWFYEFNTGLWIPSFFSL